MVLTLGELRRLSLPDETPVCVITGSNAVSGPLGPKDKIKIHRNLIVIEDKKKGDFVWEDVVSIISDEE